MRRHFFLGFLFFLVSCSGSEEKMEESSSDSEIDSTEAASVHAPIDSPIFLQVLGTIQDGGSPHIGCDLPCCEELIENPDPERKVVSLGLVDQNSEQSWMFEATPDFTAQCKLLETASGFDGLKVPDGIFLTHAHIGHYTGLAFLGKEAMNAQEVPVYVMPKMEVFLETNGPWDQLVKEKNIVLQAIQDQKETVLTNEIYVTPLLVPHRDEYSETVGYRIVGPKKSALFIPDIDKWDVWETSIEDEIAKVDYAFLDATFYGPEELKERNMDEIPHPFVVESMERLADLSSSEKEKIYFIHINHSNPIIDPNSEEHQNVLENGFHIAQFGDQFSL